MRQQLDTDSVTRVIAAEPQALYNLISDVTRTPEYSPYVKQIKWIKGATGPAVGARFRTINSMGRLSWPNWPVMTVLDPGREVAWQRTEKPGGGTVEWRYTFEAVEGGTLVTESYRVIDPVTPFGWFIIGTLAGIKDDRAALRKGMEESLERIAGLTERVKS